MVTRAQTIPLSPDTSLRRCEDLLRATSAIAGYRDIRTFRERFAEELQRFIAFDYVLVNIIDAETQAVQWRMFHAPGKNDEIVLPAFEAHETPTGLVYANQKPIVIQDWERETRYPRLREFLIRYHIRSSCVLPLTTAHSRVGVFATGISQPHIYSAEEVRFLALVADHLALAIDSALNHRARLRAHAR